MNRFLISLLFLVLVLPNRIGAQSNFQNVTEASGIVEQPQLLDRGDPGAPVAAWFDYNNDGLLDLLVGSPTIGEEFKLFHNQQSLFEDVAKEAGMMPSTVHGAAIGDYDNDGYVDLYLTCGRSINVLLRNRGDGTFEDVTETAGVSARNGHLFQNEGGTVFARMDTQSGIVEEGGVVGFADYNTGGFLDLFLASLRFQDNAGFETPGMDILYQNQGNLNHWIHKQKRNFLMSDGLQSMCFRMLLPIKRSVFLKDEKVIRWCARCNGCLLLKSRLLWERCFRVALQFVQNCLSKARL
jgi:hypothetical protein